MRLKGRIALVTGASRGLGAAAARGLRRARARIASLVARTVGGARGGRRPDQGAGRRGRHAGAARHHRRPRHRPPGRARSTSASASSTSCSAMPACSAPSRRSAISSPRSSRRVMAVNVTANWRLIRSLDPLLRALRRRPRDLRHLGHQPPRRSPTGAPTPPARRRST